MAGSHPLKLEPETAATIAILCCVVVLVCSLAIRYFDWLDQRSMRQLCGGDRIPYTARVVCVPLVQEQ